MKYIKFGIQVARKAGIRTGIRNARAYRHWSKNTRW
jgi:hypothetical protein